MDAKKRGPDAGEALRARQELRGLTRHDTKLARVLRALADGSRLTRLDAWRECGDSVLPTTISTIQARYDIDVARQTVQVQGRYHTAHVSQYWLVPAERRKARQILRRGAA